MELSYNRHGQRLQFLMRLLLQSDYFVSVTAMSPEFTAESCGVEGTKTVSPNNNNNNNNKPKKLNSVAFSPQANYTDRATAACRRS
jgi:hypothetical protein